MKVSTDKSLDADRDVTATTWTEEGIQRLPAGGKCKFRLRHMTSVAVKMMLY
jgi:hypothetical protein